MSLLIDQQKCIGCGLCVKICENKAITLDGSLARIDPELCTDCGLCATVCPKKLIVHLEEPAEATGKTDGIRGGMLAGMVKRFRGKGTGTSAFFTDGWLLSGRSDKRDRNAGAV